MALRFDSQEDGTGDRLLGPDDPSPVAFSNPGGASSFLLVGDHAGMASPAALGCLRVSDADWARHIACDLGSRALGEALAQRLDARFIHQRYSRLVIDCNRAPQHPDAIAPSSDATNIPGNRGLTVRQRRQRVAEIHKPYHAAIADELARQTDGPHPQILVSLHSFTPVWQGKPRPWHAGVLHGGGADRFALAVLAGLTDALGTVIGNNQPYRLDATDYTVPLHAIEPGRAYVELEIRQDLLATPDGTTAWADRLAGVLTAARQDTERMPAA
ncbi:N-formylglutamate amidohydrolase [Novosphingobium sp.]|uniref:N-formylglutamate amidohydrolase n=1 Tax=Novosphingobium sp. TaxID=1874826 RepID=UPI0025EC3C39|nr:N-formylglutamate amidohydrolase [Novosphingobium sp.]